jgi:hypothetical protein
MLGSVAFTLVMSARATCEFGWSRPHGANRRSSLPLRGV